MTTAACGNSFPIKTFYHQLKVINVHEAGIYTITPQSGSKMCFEPKKPIIDAVILNDGTLIVLDGSLYSLKFEGSILKISSECNHETFDIQQISSFGRNILALKDDGRSLSYEFDGEKITLSKHAIRERKSPKITLFPGIIDGNCAFYYKSDLDNVNLDLYSLSGETQSKYLDSIELSGLKTVQGHLEFSDDSNYIFLAFDGDSLSKVTWNRSSHLYRQNVYKIKTRSTNGAISFMIPASSEIIIGIVIEDSIKFWSFTCDTSWVDSAVFSEDMCLLYLNSREKSGFYSIDTKALKISLFSKIESFGISRQVQVSDNCIDRQQSLVCLSLDCDSVYSLTNGIIPRFNFNTDSIFRGISKIWALKRHHQDVCHEYLVLSSENSTIILKLEEFSLVDVTNALNIDRNVSTKNAFNLKNSGYFVHVTANKVTVLDMSKIDSAGNGLIRFEYINYDNGWNIVCHHDQYLFCFAQASKSINVFLLKHRPRDVDLVVPVANIMIEDLRIDSEISSVHVQMSESQFHVYLATASGHVYRVSLDHSFSIIGYKSILIGSPVESMETLNNENFSEIYAGTRSGELYLVNFLDLSIFKIEQLSSAPVKITKLVSNTLMCYSFDSSTLLKEDESEYFKRKVINWASETAVELIYRLGKVYIAGIKDDALFLMTIPSISKNSLSKQALISDSKISSFLLLNSGKWLLSCNNPMDKKNYLKFFDSNGSELISIDQGFNEIVYILPINNFQKYFIIASTSKDKMQSKFELIGIDSNKLEIRNEYVFEGSINMVKLGGSFIFYSIQEELFALEICPSSLKFLNRAVYHFRNSILDFDMLNNLILVSCYSDGLDVLSLDLDSEGGIKLNSRKGDKISRTCVSCLWLNHNKFAVADKRNRIHLCEITDAGRWIETMKTINFKELIIRLFILNEKIHCETISGSIIDISRELDQ